MNATTTNKTTNTNASANTSANTSANAQACCQGATEAFNGVMDVMKSGVEASQKLMNTMTNTVTKNASPFNMPNMFNMFNTDGVNTPVMTVPTAFETMTKVMNSLVDANARFATECNAMAIDAVRSNARMIERTGTMMVDQMTSKSTKPVADTTREIFDEACSFATKAGERVMKLNAEHAQHIAQLANGVMTSKTCCNA